MILPSASAGKQKNLPQAQGYGRFSGARELLAVHAAALRAALVLGRAGILETGIVDIQHFIAVVVVAGIALAVAVPVGLVGVVSRGAVILGVDDAIPVAVGVAGNWAALVLGRPRFLRAGVIDVEHLVAVVVVAGVALAVAVEVGLIGVVHLGAVVLGVGHAVTVVVGQRRGGGQRAALVLDLAGFLRTGVIDIEHFIAVIVVAGVALAVAVEIGLVRVVHLGTVVFGVGHTVLVVVGAGGGRGQRAALVR